MLSTDFELDELKEVFREICMEVKIYEKKNTRIRKKLFKYEYMNNKEWLEKTIHKNFKECGKSGIFFNKKETMSHYSCVQKIEK